MGDPEIDAISAVASALANLDEDTRGRVLRWAAERYGVSVNTTRGRRDGGASPVDYGGRASEEVTDKEIAEEAPVYEHFADLFNKARPTTDADRALVAAYWLQAIEGQATWQAASLTKELKHMGHAVANITEALNRNIERKPARIVQLKKSGSSRQARKTYKVTHEGLTYVQGMLGGEGS